MAQSDKAVSQVAASNGHDHAPPCPKAFRSLIERAEQARSGGDKRAAELLLGLAYVTYDRDVRCRVLLGLAEAAERFGLPGIARDLNVLAERDCTLGLARVTEEAQAWMLFPSTGDEASAACTHC